MRKKLKLLRVEYDLSQEEMAKKCGVTRSTYSHIEKGHRKGSMDFWLGLKAAFPDIEISEMAKVEKKRAKQTESNS